MACCPAFSTASLGNGADSMGRQLPHACMGWQQQVVSSMRRYPDMNLPTVLLYHNTKCLQTLVGLVPYGGRTLTPERALPLGMPVMELHH